MKKTIKYLTIGTIAMSLFLLTACSSQNINAKSASEITVVANELDAGQIPIMGGKVNVDFKLKNNGSEPVTVLDGETSCMCTEAIIKDKSGFESSKITMQGHGASKPVNYTLSPGEEATLTAVFDPLAHGPDATGPIMRDVYLRTNSSTSPKIKLSFQGNVIK